MTSLPTCPHSPLNLRGQKPHFTTGQVSPPPTLPPPHPPDPYPLCRCCRAPGSAGFKPYPTSQSAPTFSATCAPLPTRWAREGAFICGLGGQLEGVPLRDACAGCCWVTGPPPSALAPPHTFTLPHIHPLRAACAGCCWVSWPPPSAAARPTVCSTTSTPWTRTSAAPSRCRSWRRLPSR